VKILILSNHIAALPTINALFEKKWLEGVVTSGIQLIKNEIHDFCDLKGIACYGIIEEKSFSEQIYDLIISTKVELVLVFGFSKKIPAQLLELPSLGFYNVHFSLLPAYRGSAPLFWQIKSGEPFTGITIHKVAERFDTGPILYQQQVLIFTEENFGALNHRLSLLAVNVINQALNQIIDGTDQLKPQEESDAFAFPPVKAHDVVINWERHTAAEIMNLVNACNPIYTGAVTLFGAQELVLVEVSPAFINDAVGHEPGTIIYADANYGLFVACKYDSFLRINIVQTTEGLLSGYKLIAMGLKVGDRFTTCLNQEALY